MNASFQSCAIFPFLEIIDDFVNGFIPPYMSPTEMSFFGYL
jgi:hypothetical protein